LEEVGRDLSRPHQQCRETRCGVPPRSMASCSSWASMSPSPRFRSIWCPGGIDHCRPGRPSFAIIWKGLHSIDLFVVPTIAFQQLFAGHRDPQQNAVTRPSQFLAANSASSCSSEGNEAAPGRVSDFVGSEGFSPASTCGGITNSSARATMSINMRSAPTVVDATEIPFRSSADIPPYLRQCMSPRMARRVDSLRCRTFAAKEAKRTSDEG
jgi:hypothetical protein